MSDKPKRKAVDWEGISKEYRAGQLSVRQIAREFEVSETAVRKRAKAENWERDLTEEVRKAVRAKLVRSDVRTPHDDAAIIEEKATDGARVILRHRAVLERHSEHIVLLQEKLEELLPNANSADAIEQLQGIVESMARTRRALIPLERQAFNLDEPREDAAGFAVEIVRFSKPGTPS